MRAEQPQQACQAEEGRLLTHGRPFLCINSHFLF